MANWDMFRQYQSELERIQREIDAEENPYHKQHIKEFSDMCDEKIRTMVPELIRQQAETQRINVETYLNGRQVRTNGDIIKGVRSLIVDAFKRCGMKSK